MKTLLLTLALVATSFPATAEPGKNFDLAELRWLEGCWAGTGFGKRVTECWMSAPNGRLTGMFQLIDDDGRQEMSEIFVLDEFENGPAIRLKHFGPDLVGWEAQDGYVVFELLETGPALARFEGLTYRLDEDGRLIIDLAVTRNGERSIERLDLERLFGPGT